MTTTDTSIRDAYLAAAGTVGPLLRDPAVAAGWDGPSALPEFSVRGLAGHLSSQIFMIGSSIAGVGSDLDAIALGDHYARVTWIDAPPDTAVNTSFATTASKLPRSAPQRWPTRSTPPSRARPSRSRRSLASTVSPHRPASGRSCSTTSS